LRFSPETEAAAYYTCAEALANSARYSGASSISIDVTVRAGDLLIVVADDGRGGADPAQGTGLRGLADRLDAVGGRFAVYSPPGGGTRLSATIRVA
jgi:signal transduction histidine kinase